MSLPATNRKRPSFNPSFSPPPSARRRRAQVLLALACAAVLALFAGIPQYTLRALSHALRAPPRPEINEIYGLLHLVTGEHPHTLGHTDPTEPLPLAVYAGDEEVDWEEEAADLDERTPVVIFSKTYCPYSKRAKKLLTKKYELSPPPSIVEVDLRDDGVQIKQLLGRLTGRATFPNVIVRGRSIGGSDDVQKLHRDGELRALLEEAGVEVAVVEPSVAADGI
ncbi:thioredoxin-like protein [Schizophyllum amplum]|uniref:Thioredoxin-like protein n=1 Tax=Schizophyllum amplum TaxID=97359 RepID=A0A550CZJ5_9AGAR|nr:thioredoxin-like protein [Auriculariopsis ampla]